MISSVFTAYSIRIHFVCFAYIHAVRPVNGLARVRTC